MHTAQVDEEGLPLVYNEDKIRQFWQNKCVARLGHHGRTLTPCRLHAQVVCPTTGGASLLRGGHPLLQYQAT